MNYTSNYSSIHRIQLCNGGLSNMHIIIRYFELPTSRLWCHGFSSDLPPSTEQPHHFNVELFSVTSHYIGHFPNFPNIISHTSTKQPQGDETVCPSVMSATSYVIEVYLWPLLNKKGCPYFDTCVPQFTSEWFFVLLHVPPQWWKEHMYMPAG